MTTLAMSGGVGSSSPFYDYVNDAIYAGDNSGTLPKFTGVFNGTPAAASSALQPRAGCGLRTRHPGLYTRQAGIFVPYQRPLGPVVNFLAALPGKSHRAVG